MMQPIAIKTVCLLGGSGFVGRHLAHQLSEQGYRVRVLTRNRERAKQLIVLPTVDVVQADVHAAGQLSRHVEGADAVVNLVGILHQSKARLGASFQQAHLEFTRKVIAACQENGVRRLLHMSALGANPQGPSAYLRSKGAAEQLVRESDALTGLNGASPGLCSTIFRPSVLFGPGDSFLSLFAKAMRIAPILFLPCPGARFQPVYVEDVARSFTLALANPATWGQTYDLCGPRIYTLRELIDLVGAATGCRRPVIELNDRLSYWQARLMELSPVKLLTRDNYDSMRLDNVCACAFPAIFALQPTALEAVVDGYLGGQTPRSRYRLFRVRAGRRAG
jgi:uncharacterized protein YbjT (DUF2867 family)